MPAPLNNNKTPDPSNPSSLNSRYEIHRLTPADAQFAAAIIGHANGFHSPMWPVLYPENMVGRVGEIMAAMDYLVQHQISSGMSFGVFDTEYQYKTEEGKAAGGKLFWDFDSKDTEGMDLRSAGEKLLSQMDFPLVSVALSYDGANPLDMSQMGPLLNSLPHFGLVYQVLGANDTRDAASWAPTGPKQVLMRNATATRHDYEGEKIMGGLARWLMREAAKEGYRGIQIECLSDAVTHVWSTGEEPFKAGVVSEFDCGTWKNEEGEVAFHPVQLRATKCYVDLKPGSN